MNIKKLKLSFWKAVAGIAFVFGIYATFVRFTQGLGGATNLTDEFPWGLWIGFDVLVGVGLAAGGFVIAATVHIFNLEKYKVISRPVILTAFLGYSLVIVALLFDLGRPYRIWHPLIMWNPHSVMFEVAWCVTLYTIVLALEFSPIVLEKFKLKTPLKVIRLLYIPLVILGVLLSTLHQSSLGTLYVLVPEKLHGLWYSPLLPVFFFISAIAAGLAMTIFESFLSQRAFNKKLEPEVLTSLARVLVVVLAVYLVLKFQDLAGRGNLALAFTMSREMVLFWGEIGLGVILPMLLLFSARIRENQAGLFFSVLLVIVGFVVNRLNVSITGMLNSETYFPKWTEISVTVAIVALGFVIFVYAVKHFPVFSSDETETIAPASAAATSSPVFSGNVVLAFWALLLTGMIAYGMASNHANGDALTDSAVIYANRTVDPFKQELQLPQDIEFISSEDNPGAVIFSHESHVLIQKRPDCATCHAGGYKIIASAESQRSHGETMHSEQSCGKCHDGEQAFSVEEDCESCHQEE